MIVVWRITARCNLGCPFCAYDRNLTFQRAESEPDAVLRFAEILAEFQANSGQLVMVSWLGGEPLLWKPITRLSAVMSRDLRLRISATTNGTTLQSAATLRLIADHFDELTVSVDGPQAFHDRIRGWPGGFERLRAGIARLREMSADRPRRLRLRVNTVLMSHNLRLFAELCEELLGWDIDEITFNQLGGNDRPEFYRQHRLGVAEVEQLAELLPPLRDKLQAGGVRLAGGMEYLGRLRASAEGRGLPVENCQPGRKFLFIDEYGRIGPCSFTIADYGLPIAAIKSAGELAALSECFQSEVARRRSRWCDDCPSTQVFDKFVA